MEKFQFIRKIFFLLEKKRMKLFVSIFLLSFIAMILETIGISLLIPLVMLISSTDLILNNYYISKYFPFILGLSQFQLIIYASLLFIIFYLFKIIFLIMINYLNSYFVQTQQIYLSKRLLQHYLKLPYAFHLKRNSSSLVRNIVSEVGSFTTILISILNLVIDVLIIIGISIFLMIYDFNTAVIIILIFIIGGYAFDFLLKSRLKIWGEKRLFHTEKLFKSLQESLGGIKDVILLGRFKEFLTNFDYHNSVHAKIKKWVVFSSTLPRQWYELIGVSILISVIIFNLQNKNITELITLLVVFSAASLRLMPSFNRLIISFQNIRTLAPSINNLYVEFVKHEIIQLDNSKKDQMHFNEKIALKNISFYYDRKDKTSLRDINLLIEKSQILGIYGKSGSGKTTLLDIIMGILKPTSGEVFLDNTLISDNLRSYQDMIGYVSQNIFLTDDTLAKNIAFGIKEDEINQIKLNEAIKNASLDTYINNLDNGVETYVGERGVRMSGGQRQRVGIARALYLNPSILILDESTSALDIQTEKEIMNSINKLRGQITIIIVSHKPSTLSICDKVIELENGKIIKD